MDRAQFLRRVKFILKFGRALHAVGSPAHSLEGTMQELCQLFGLKGNIVSLPTAIFSSFSYGDEEITKIERVTPMGVHLSKLSKVDLVARDVIGGKLTFEEGSDTLDKILASPDPYGKRIRVLCFMLSAAGFMVLFGGNWGDFWASMLIGTLIGILSLFQPAQGSIGLVSQVFEPLIAVVAALTTSLLAKLFPSLNLSVVILSSLIIFMPGFLITMAIAEIATQNLTSGTSRLMGGIMILLKLTFGVYLGVKIGSYFSLPALDLHFGKISNFTVYLTLPITALMTTVIFKADRKDWKWVTFAGIFGFAISKIATFYFGAEMGILLGGFFVGSFANIFARLMDRPSGIFQFPGIILLVPGSVGYRSLYFLFERDIVGGMGMAFNMLALAMALVVGVFFGNILVKPRRSL